MLYSKKVPYYQQQQLQPNPVLFDCSNDIVVRRHRRITRNCSYKEQQERMQLQVKQPMKSSAGKRTLLVRVPINRGVTTNMKWMSRFLLLLILLQVTIILQLGDCILLCSAFTPTVHSTTTTQQQQNNGLVLNIGSRIPLQQQYSDNVNRRYTLRNEDNKGNVPSTTRTVLYANKVDHSDNDTNDKNKNSNEYSSTRYNEMIQDNDQLYDSDVRDQWYTSSMTTTMVGTQASLIPLGIIASSLLHIDLQFHIAGSDNNIVLLYGLLSTIPLLLLAVVLDSMEKNVPALHEVSIATQRLVYNLLGGTYKPILAFFTAITLGFVAGVGEEIIFRGIIQNKVYDTVLSLWNYSDNTMMYIPTTISIVVASILFGIIHAVTPTYVILATIASIYFGILYVFTANEYNLIIPILCHSLYDFGALYYAHYQVSHLPLDQLQQLVLSDPTTTTDKE